MRFFLCICILTLTTIDPVLSGGGWLAGLSCAGNSGSDPDSESFDMTQELTRNQTHQYDTPEQRVRRTNLIMERRQEGTLNDGFFSDETIRSRLEEINRYRYREASHLQTTRNVYVRRADGFEITTTDVEHNAAHSGGCSCTRVKSFYSNDGSIYIYDRSINPNARYSLTDVLRNQWLEASERNGLPTLLPRKIEVIFLTPETNAYNNLISDFATFDFDQGERVSLLGKFLDATEPKYTATLLGNQFGLTMRISEAIKEGDTVLLRAQFIPNAFPDSVTELYRFPPPPPTGKL